ncbi:receptor-like protein EIX1 [Aegilops tauschii subsp. strangulata]|nr:receptor-like protein EIX2 [Aegilops tauschii subsp. strangulata]
MTMLRFLAQGTLIALSCLLFSIPPAATASIRPPAPPPPPSASNGSCIAYERAALLSIRASLWNPNFDFSSWQGEDCCTWKGVRCSYRTGHVVKLNLRGKSNCYPVDENRGEISHSLVSLQQLRYLDMSCNNFNGAKIPESIGSLPSLRYLNLSYNWFYGRVPPQIGNLSKLTYLDLKPSDSFSLELYSGDVHWLSHLSSLKHLDLSHMNLTAAVDWVHQVNMLPALRKLYLQYTGIRNRVAFLGQSNLTALEVLDISGNNFSTTISPNWFWNTTSLTYLNLKGCNFRGPIPDSIGNMTSLEQVYFQRNNLMATMIPYGFRNLCSLKILDLEQSNTSGDITELMERLPNCPSNMLQILDFSYNNISGALPNWPGPLTNLTYLVLSGTNITGPIPEWIGALTELVSLELGGNRLNGIVTEYHLKGLKDLKFLGLHNTDLQIKVSPNWIPPFKLQAIFLASLQLGPAFPPWLRSQTGLQLLHMSNASITAIPAWFWVAFSRTNFIDLSDNEITGTLPATLEFMSTQKMVLSNNRLIGMVPKFPRNTEYMDLSGNSFSGTLPSDFAAPLLEELILYNNSISGTIPSSICSLSQLVVLDLSGNKLTGEVPTCEEDSNSQMSSLHVVNLNTNNLSGDFPKVLRNCQYLVFIDLSYNKFSGDLPTWMGVNFPYLALLRLRYNMFSGKIPVEIGMLQGLQFLDLAHNKFSGSMPDSLVKISAMAQSSGYSYALYQALLSGQGLQIYNSVYDGVYSMDKVSVLTKGQQLEFSLQISYMVILDLSSNSLTGVIPRDIGCLIGLRGLNFSWNNLSGEIPKKIGELKQLESLDLSNNELSGGIPSSMETMTSLSHMNLSYNTLSGKIPLGNQLGTFDASAYIGNIGLCGFPLTPSCLGNRSGQPRYKDDGDGLEDISLYLGLTVGFAFGFGVVFCVMLFKKRWRISYFMFVEGLQDKIYVVVVLKWANLKRKLVKT